MNGNPDSRTRIYSIDFLRGLVMIIMALDHTRDFFHFDSFLHDPLDVTTTSPLLYFTRWITNFCAPVFVFLAGISIYLQSLRKSKNELSALLLKRGIWLIVVEVVLISFSWTFDLGFRVFILQVIWAIGISMVFMSFISRLPFQIVFVLGLIIVLGHNVLDYLPATHNGLFWDLLHNGNFSTYQILPARNITIVYPFLPWLGLIMIGYSAGKWFKEGVDLQSRKTKLVTSGFLLLLLFFVLRLINQYGDPNAWSQQKNFLFTTLSFLNVNKYPPSLMFMCITIGPAFLVLAWAENLNTRLSRAISVYGKVPFFYYVLHFYILHLACMLLFVFRGHSIKEPTPDIWGMPFRFQIVGEGYPLSIVYIIWVLVVLLLYPLCKWFATYKQKNKYHWLSYL